MILTLALRNLLRRKRRTAFSVIAIAATSAFLIALGSLQAGTYNTMIRANAQLLDGYAQIQNPAYLDQPAMRNSFRPGDGVQAAISDLPRSVHAAERGVAFALLSSEGRSVGAQITGVDPAREPLVSSIPGALSAGRALQANEGAILLGEVLARNLRVSVGETVTLLGVGRDESLAVDVLTVVGLFRTGITELDRQMAQMPLERFDETFGMYGQRHAIVLNGPDFAAIRGALGEVRRGAGMQELAVHDWAALQPSIARSIELDLVTSVPIYAILVLVVIAALLNTLMLSVIERTREFGMMLALGVRPGLLGAIVWTEIGLIGGIGAVLGMALGAGITGVLMHYGINVAAFEEMTAQYNLPTTLYPELNAVTLLAAPVAMLVMLGLAGLFPVLRIQGLNIIEAMRAG